MPIHLTAPQQPAGGPDGKGWTRLAIASCVTAMDRCALRPRDYNGNCQDCPVFARLTGREVTLQAFTDEVLVRVDDQGRPWLMDHPEKGWASLAVRWTWEKLAVLTGWHPAQTHRDEHGTGFWLCRDDDNPAPQI